MDVKYQATVFANWSAIKADSKEIMRVMGALTKKDLELVPAAFHEVTPPDLVPQPRLRFTTPSGEMEFMVSSVRLDINQHYPSIKGAGLLDRAGFSLFAEQCLEAVIGERSIRANRLALVVNTMSSEASSDEVLAKTAEDFLVLPKYFAGGDLPEWTFRANRVSELKFGQRAEMVNAILKLERVRGQFKNNALVAEFDRISSELDINTLQEDATPRFDMADFHSFLLSAFERQAEIVSDIANKIS